MSVIGIKKCKNCGHDIVIYDVGPPMHVKLAKAENKIHDDYPTLECQVPSCHCRSADY